MWHRGQEGWQTRVFCTPTCIWVGSQERWHTLSFESFQFCFQLLLFLSAVLQLFLSNFQFVFSLFFSSVQSPSCEIYDWGCPLGRCLQCLVLWMNRVGVSKFLSFQTLILYRPINFNFFSYILLTGLAVTRHFSYFCFGQGWHTQGLLCFMIPIRLVFLFIFIPDF